MKVLLVNCVYGSGSTGKILKDLHLGLSKLGWDSTVCYARGPRSSDNKVIKLASENLMKLQALASRISGFSYGCSPLSTRMLKIQIKKIKPDIVNLHCINANTVNIIDILNYLKNQNIPTVISFHAEFLYTGGCAHSLNCTKWLHGCNKCPQFKTNDSQLPVSWFFDTSSQFWHGLKNAYSNFEKLRLTCVSPWVKSRAIQSPFFSENKIFVTPNGVNTSIFHPVDSSFLKKRHNISENARIYLHPTPNFASPLKGGKYIIEFAKKLAEKKSEDRIIIIGYNGNPADLPSNIIGLSHTADQQELAAYYSIADVTLLTSERETFSMVTAESLCCGTPVVGFKAGGPESICTKGYSYFVDYGDIDALFFIALNTPKQKKISQVYSPIFSTENMIREYINVYESLS